MTLATVTIAMMKGLALIEKHVIRTFSVCNVGRASDCFPRVPNDQSHPVISRQHCKLIIDPPKVWLKDLDSLNGTRVNGRMLRHGAGPMRLRDGDYVTLGADIHLGIFIGCVDLDASCGDGSKSCNINPNMVMTTKDESLHVRFVGHKVRFCDGHMHLLEEQLADVLPGLPFKEVVFECGNVECVASVVIAKLLRLKQQLATKDIRFRLKSLKPYVQELFQSSQTIGSLARTSMRMNIPESQIKKWLAKR